MATKKMTRIEALEIAMATVENAEALQVLEAIKVSIEKSNARKSTSTNSKKAVAQNEAMQNILEVLDTENFLAYSELTLDFATISNQKFTALMKKAVEQGLVEKGTSLTKKVGYRLVK